MQTMKHTPNHASFRCAGLLAITLSLLLFTVACTHAGKKQYDPAKVGFSAAINPLFDSQLYPSLILALNQTAQPTATTAQLQPLTFQVTAPHNNAVLRVVIDSSALNYVTYFQEILPERGKTYTFSPSIKWKYDRLRTLRQPRALDLTLTCYINDEEVDIKNLHLSARSVNECPLSFRLPTSATATSAPTNSIVDTRWLFAAYVNEDHPYIQQILTDILDQGIVSRLSGYQSSNPSAVSDQVFAVWHYALSRGIAYSSISCTSNPSPLSNVQHIRFFDEVYNTRQANCIDACVFFASIMRKIGLHPIIFVEPCHAYLGYYSDRKHSRVALLETTITSWVNFPLMERSLDADGRLPQQQLDRVAKYLTPQQLKDYQSGKLTFEQLKKAVSRTLFDRASKYNQESYDNNRKLFADTTAITYQQLDIDKLRPLVQPIN